MANFSELTKHQDLIYEIRPVPLSKIDGKLTPTLYNQWKIRVSKARRVIEIRNIVTAHHIDIGGDHYYDFRTPNFLVLKCRLIMEGASLHLEPLPDPRASVRRRSPRP